MIITVSPELLDLIKLTEALELDSVPNAEFSWSYYPDGRGATGVAFVNWSYKEFDLYASPNGSIGATFRELSKYDGDFTETHPLDSDYEESI